MPRPQRCGIKRCSPSKVSHRRSKYFFPQVNDQLQLYENQMYTRNPSKLQLLKITLQNRLREAEQGQGSILTSLDTNLKSLRVIQLAAGAGPGALVMRFMLLLPILSQHWHPGYIYPPHSFTHLICHCITALRCLLPVQMLPNILLHCTVTSVEETLKGDLLLYLKWVTGSVEWD